MVTCYTEKSVVDLFWIKLLVLCNTCLHMRFMHRSFGFSGECRSTKFLCKFDGYMYTEKSVVDLFGLNCSCIV